VWDRRASNGRTEAQGPERLPRPLAALLTYPVRLADPRAPHIGGGTATGKVQRLGTFGNVGPFGLWPRQDRLAPQRLRGHDRNALVSVRLFSVSTRLHVVIIRL
jgi:hypothetical protein